MRRSRKASTVAALAAAVVLTMALAMVWAGPAAARVAQGDDRSPEQIEQRARQVLDRDEFKDQTTILQRILDWIGDHVPTPDTSSAGQGGSGLVGNIVLLVVAAALVFGLVKVAQGIRRLPPKARDPGPVLDVEERRPAKAWRRDAEEHEAAGRWREAMLARYRELVTTLIDAGALVDVPGRTSGEFRVELAAAQPSHATAFTEATDLFERAWYGAEPTGPEENARFRALAAQVTAPDRPLVDA
jgi:hypothetical protein